MEKISADDLYASLVAATNDLQHNLAFWNYYRVGGDKLGMKAAMEAMEYKQQVVKELLGALYRATVWENKGE